MSLPKFPDNDSSITREDVINQILSSIAMEELGLSHIINAEGEKLQYALGTLDGAAGPEEPPTIEELLELNQSIHKTLDGTMKNQLFLSEKMQYALSAAIMQGPAGPEGLQGPTGPMGPTGAQGQEGPRGSEGPQGVQGEAGPLGPQGSQGIQGEAGPLGPQGPQGIQGETGLQGTVGPQGNQGDVGPLGPQGPQGLQGDAGLQGPTGPQGIQGNAGSQGTQGPQGLQGETGSEGPQGSQGVAGTAGTIKGSFTSLEDLKDEYPVGTIGDLYYIDPDLYAWDDKTGEWINLGQIAGPQGIQGDPGPQGAVGPQGAQGETGAQGPAGLQGIQGDPGPQGLTGSQGIQGDPGPQGPAGAQGAQGESGPQGPAGPQGVQGDPGPQGPEGPQGVQGLQGPTGPQGATGSTGPTGSAWMPDQKLFTVSGETGSADVTYEGNLNFTSDTLDISVGPGSTVKIEEPNRVGTIIPFSSGIQLSTNTRTGNGERANVAMVAFGNGKTITSTADPIRLPDSGAVVGTVQTDFSIPADGTITSISAFYTAMSGGLAGIDTYITAQLFQTRDPDSNEFFAIPESKVEFDPISGSVLPSVLRQKIVTGLSISVKAQTRLLIGFFSRTPGYTITSTVMTGYMSGSLEIK